MVSEICCCVFFSIITQFTGQHQRRQRRRHLWRCRVVYANSDRQLCHQRLVVDACERKYICRRYYVRRGWCCRREQPQCDVRVHSERQRQRGADDHVSGACACAFVRCILNNINTRTQANIIANNDAGQCHAAVSYTAPVGADNCAGATTTRTGGVASGTTLAVGSTTVNEFTVTAANGQTDSCLFTITVVDNAAPTITCPVCV